MLNFIILVFGIAMVAIGALGVRNERKAHGKILGPVPLVVTIVGVTLTVWAYLNLTTL